MDEARIAEMIARHYRDEWGNCAACMIDDDWGASVEWPCDTAYLLQKMGHTLREDPPFVRRAPDPNAPDTPNYFIPEIWSEATEKLLADYVAMRPLV